jgi:hypothetical protein
MMAALAQAALSQLPSRQPPDAPPQGPLMSPGSPGSPDERVQLRLQSAGWALLAGATAGLAGTALALTDPASLGPPALEAGLRAAGCGFFYGLLAFHLQRVDPDDSHLQAGLVGAACGFRSLSAPTPSLTLAPSLMMEWARIWLPLWLPLIGSALLLHGFQRLLVARHQSTRASTRP